MRSSATVENQALNLGDVNFPSPRFVKLKLSHRNSASESIVFELKNGVYEGLYKLNPRGEIVSDTVNNAHSTRLNEQYEKHFSSGSFWTKGKVYLNENNMRDLLQRDSNYVQAVKVNFPSSDNTSTTAQTTLSIQRIFNQQRYDFLLTRDIGSGNYVYAIDVPDGERDVLASWLRLDVHTDFSAKHGKIRILKDTADKEVAGKLTGKFFAYISNTNTGLVNQPVANITNLANITSTDDDAVSNTTTSNANTSNAENAVRENRQQLSTKIEVSALDVTGNFASPQFVRINLTPKRKKPNFIVFELVNGKYVSILKFQDKEVDKKLFISTEDTGRLNSLYCSNILSGCNKKFRTNNEVYQDEDQMRTLLKNFPDSVTAVNVNYPGNGNTNAQKEAPPAHLFIKRTYHVNTTYQFNLQNPTTKKYEYIMDVGDNGKASAIKNWLKANVHSDFYQNSNTLCIDADKAQELKNKSVNNKFEVYFSNNVDITNTANITSTNNIPPVQSTTNDGDNFDLQQDFFSISAPGNNSNVNVNLAYGNTTSHQQYAALADEDSALLWNALESDYSTKTNVNPPINNNASISNKGKQEELPQDFYDDASWQYFLSPNSTNAASETDSHQPLIAPHSNFNLLNQLHSIHQGSAPEVSLPTNPQATETAQNDNDINSSLWALKEHVENLGNEEDSNVTKKRRTL